MERWQLFVFDEWTELWIIEGYETEAYSGGGEWCGAPLWVVKNVPFLITFNFGLHPFMSVAPYLALKKVIHIN